jgi:hypothetical protein
MALARPFEALLVETDAVPEPESRWQRLRADAAFRGNDELPVCALANDLLAILPLE